MEILRNIVDNFPYNVEYYHGENLSENLTRINITYTKPNIDREFTLIVRYSHERQDLDFLVVTEFSEVVEYKIISVVVEEFKKLKLI